MLVEAFQYEIKHQGERFPLGFKKGTQRTLFWTLRCSISLGVSSLQTLRGLQHPDDRVPATTCWEQETGHLHTPTRPSNPARACRLPQ